MKLAARLAVAAAVILGADAATATDVVRRHGEIMSTFAAELESLAQSCVEKGLVQEAATARQWIAKPEPLSLQLAVPPIDEGGATEAQPAESEFQAELARLRERQAERLFELARQAAGEHEAAWAVQLLYWTLRENPRHAQARAMLGYELHAGRWLTPFQISKERAGQVWHDRFGWLSKDHVARYEAGQRYYRNRWLEADEEARLRGSLERGWDVATEHFQVHTSHSLEAGVRLAEQLEGLHRVWRQLFAGFYLTDTQLERCFAAASPLPRVTRKHKVVYYRDRNEYRSALADKHPRIGITLGYYDAQGRKAHFFASDEPSDGTLFHEATHQLFNETRPSGRAIAQEANFWVVEGIACYLESLVLGKEIDVVGGAGAVRLGDARYRLLEDDFYVPLSELIGFGMERLQNDQRIAMLYSQASGLTWFLMHAQDGRYRECLVDYLAAIYAARDQPDTLPTLAGQRCGELDRAYRAFMETTTSP